MNRDAVIRLAREAGGTPYTNRYVDGSAFAFSAEKLDAFAALVAAEVRTEIANKLKKAGAKLPVENHGTIESAMNTGLSIALCIVENPTC